LPQEDSPASIFGSGVFNARGFPLSNLQAVFGYERGTYEVSMYSIQERTVTVVALPEAMAKSWLSNHPGKGRIIETSLAIPGQTLVVRKTLDSDLKLQIAAWFASTQVGAQKLSPYVAEEFNYIHGLTR
jgi:ABC-type phosphate/phosphonate transport system substrate-binding protein